MAETENLKLPLITKEVDIKTLDWALSLNGENGETDSMAQKIDAAVGKINQTPITWGMLKSGLNLTLTETEDGGG